MLYQLAHSIQQHCPILWSAIEGVNTLLFGMRYGCSLKVLQALSIEGVRLAKKEDEDALVAFFAAQDAEAFTYFKPHGFDHQSIHRLLRRKSMIIWLSENETHQLTGYAFMRCFWMGKGYRGYMVDTRHRGQGIGRLLGIALNATQKELGIRTYKSISPNNIASLALAERTCRLAVIEKTKNGDTCYQCLLE